MAEKHSLSDEGCGEVVTFNALFVNDVNQLCLQLFLNAPCLLELVIDIQNLLSGCFKCECKFPL